MIKKIRHSLTFKSSSLGISESRIRNDRQSVFSLVKELVHAQFELSDQELTNRLWQEINSREIDLDRVINLMYSSSCQDESVMLEADLAFFSGGLI